MTFDEFKEKRDKYINNGCLNRGYPIFTIDSNGILNDLTIDM